MSEKREPVAVDSGEDASAYERLVEMVRQRGVPFVLHAHHPARTVADAARLPFDPGRIVKTIAFRVAGNGGIVLAVLQGAGRVEYPVLSALLGVNRRNLAPLSPEEVKEFLGVEPGSVSPLPLRQDAGVIIDADVMSLAPTIYCGIGRADRTLEIAPVDLVAVAGGRIGAFSRS